MGLAALSKRLLAQLRVRAPETDPRRRTPQLLVRGLERRVVLDASVALGSGSVDLGAFDPGTTVTVTQDVFDLNGDSSDESVYRFELDAGTWTDGFADLVGGIDLDGVAGVDAFVDGTNLYVSASFLETNAGGVSIGADGSAPTIVLGDNLTTAGDQDYGGAVGLAQDVVLNAGVGNVLFTGSVSGPFSLSIESSGVTTFQAAVNVGSLTTDAGGQTSFTPGVGSVTTTGVQVYGDTVVLGSDLVMTGSQVEFQDDLNGLDHSLDIHGDAVLGQDGGDLVFGLDQLSITGATTINAGNIQTLADQSYGGDVTLGSNVTLTATQVEFAGNVDGAGNGLEIQGDAVLGDSVADEVTNLSSLHVTGDSTIAAGLVSSTGEQTFDGNVSIINDMEFEASLVTFHGDLLGGNNDVTITGDAQLGDSTLDSVSGLDSLIVTGDATANAALGPFATNVEFRGDLTLGRDLTLDAPDVLLGGNVIGTGHSLAIVGTAVLGNDAGDTFSGLASLTVTGPAATIGAGSIETTGVQTYDAPVQLAADVSLTASVVTFLGQVVGGGHSLQIAGDASFGDDAADSVTGLSTLTVEGATTFHTSVVTTSGGQTYKGPVTVASTNGLLSLTGGGPIDFQSTLLLSADLTVVSGDDVTFGGAVDGAHDLIVNTSGMTAFNGAVGGTTALASITTDAGGTTLINGGLIRTSGDQFYGDDVELGAGVHELSGGVIHFFGRVDGQVQGQGGLAITSAQAVVFDRAIGSLRDPASIQVRAVDLTFADGTFIDVAGSAAESVHLVATGTLVLPVGFVVRAALGAGGYEGVANTFLPRPSPGATGTALVELPHDRPIYSSNPNLDQSATGTIEMVVGNAGEKGLRVFVDWGDTVSQGNRFEGPGGWADGDGLGDNDDPGDLYAIEGGSTVELTHTYTAHDIQRQLLVDNTFDVKYAVFQHEAIVIEAARVEQGAQSLGTAGGALNVLTSTMVFSGPGGPRFEPPDPATVPNLVNGTAGVQIAPPSGSVPFEFPIARPEVAVPPNNELPPLDPLVTLSQVTMDEGASSSPVVGRQQRFVLRLLSPDPTAPPLAEVDLPADSFQADRLQRLFQELPDGSYEIDLLLGENTERPILRFDIRQGRPVVPQESLDGGQLRLEEIQDTLRKHSEPQSPAVETTAIENREADGLERDVEAEESAQPDSDVAVEPGNSSRVVEPAGRMSSRLEWQLRRGAETGDGSLLLASRLARRVRG
ncbi:hypothetical protein Pan44_01220 [Caulifigura coniformis]|uniref:Autotransporter-associated beta strand repeat protein n=1 Tax=Caulifigura coniformis TaxID=2527983 RepID=A0A517S7N0_9PLAN|nr:hypothetical protein [Caulifigura coniformis]QDT52113.1 hypothetical protein Pan44_01220 [Caulifigura coniformis]